MSIGKRFMNLVRSNLNTLIDRTAEWDTRGKRLEDLSDDELEAELRRRQTRREAADRAAAVDSSAGGNVDQDAWREVEETLRGSRYRTTGRPSRGYERINRRRGGSAAATGQDPRLARLYAQLECPYGSDLNAVRKQYRVMMRKYHPDVHSGEPSKQRLATELSQRLTAAYNELRRALSNP